MDTLEFVAGVEKSISEHESSSSKKKKIDAFHRGKDGCGGCMALKPYQRY